MKEWFAELAPRERMLMIAAGALTVVALVIVLGIRPLFTNASRAEQRVSDKQAILLELDQLASRLGPGGGNGAGQARDSGQSLVVLIDRSTRSMGLSDYVKRNQPEGKTSIRLRFENAPFDTLIKWLNQISNQHGLSAISVNIDPGQATGRVNCNLILTRPGI
jgi:general secretion pathway protein M